MIRGTNAQFKFKLPYKKDELNWVTIKFWQPGNNTSLLPITKTIEHCDSPYNSTDLYVSLTAEETARFLEKYKAKVQLRGQSTDGTIFGCSPKLITVYPMRDDIIEENPTLPTENEEGWLIFDGKPVIY